MIGAVIFGLIFSYLAAKILEKIVRNDTFVIILTISFSYFSFYCSEVYFKISGIINIVTFGIFLKILIGQKIHFKTVK